ncbi:hypothetical protein EDD18DRAFT_1355461 [Armillaria luteobubalina]|uniref:Cytochrome P450 n=1 Tax=Armillaria luteobubalina TaxID=153913 RepID=A0AA39Q2P5_9AGAR|nr:hypothetical protein EDD18DRAFT_1355461 [Armillaria luteobubalina]
MLSNPGLFGLPSALTVPLATLVLIHLCTFFCSPYGFRSFPCPFLAKFSDARLGWVSYGGHRSETIHELHKKYGTFVRIAPNHLSTVSPEALQVTYAHGNGALKSPFYHAIVSIQRGLFNTRDHAQHSRKQKIILHIFSQKSVMEFEPSLHLYIGQLISQWEHLYGGAVRGKSGTDGEGGWSGHDGHLWLDCFFSFGIFGNLAIRTPFGMIIAAKDSALLPKSNKGVAAIGQKTSCAVVEI